jgi:hypothetical protein
MRKPALSALAALLVLGTALGQRAELQRIDERLAATFQKLLEADGDTRFEIIAPLFKKQLVSDLAHPVTFHGDLVELSKYVVIEASPDGRVKFYSWDDFTGGTWHHISAVAQFLTDEGKIAVWPLNPENEIETGEFTDCLIYEVHEILFGQANKYLTFGRGTHGSGNQHSIMRIFEIAGDRLVQCDGCFAADVDHAIEYPRVENLNLAFNTETNEITHDEFQWDGETGRNRRTGVTVTLRLINGRFEKK